MPFTMGGSYRLSWCSCQSSRVFLPWWHGGRCFPPSSKRLAQARDCALGAIGREELVRSRGRVPAGQRNLSVQEGLRSVRRHVEARASESLVYRFSQVNQQRKQPDTRAKWCLHPRDFAWCATFQRERWRHPDVDRLVHSGETDRN